MYVSQIVSFCEITALCTFVLSELFRYLKGKCPKCHFVLFALLKWFEGGQVCVYCYDIINWQD